MSVKVGTINAPTAAGTQAYTGVGFQPDLVLFFLTRQTADGYAADATMGIGAAISSTERFAYGNHAVDNVAAGTASRLQRQLSNVRCIFQYETATGDWLAADLVSMDADGFTLNWTTAAAGRDYLVRYVALAGLADASIVAWTPSGAASSQAVTGAGFQPDVVLNFGNKIKFSDGNDVSAIAMFLGVMTAADENAMAYRESAASPTSGARWQATGSGGASYGFLEVASGETAAGRFTHTSMDADGFTVDWTAGAGDATAQVASLCIKGGSWATGADTQKTSGGTKATTGVGFRPEGVLFFGDVSASASSVLENGHTKLAIGATDGTASVSIWNETQDNVATTEANSRTVATACLSHPTGPSTTSAEAAISSLDADGFTLNWTTADGTAREFFYLAFRFAGATQPTAPQFLSAIGS